MSKRSPAWTIYKKELLDTLRDRRTLAAMLLVPMVAYPVALLVTSQTIAVERRAVEDRRALVEFVTPLPADMAQLFAQDDRITVQLSTTTSHLDADERRVRAKAALRGGSDVVLAMSATAAAAFDGLGMGELELFFDGTRPYADAGVTRVERLIEQINADRRASRMTAAGLPASAADPLKLYRSSVASSVEVRNQILGSMLPALVLVFIAISCFYPAVDLTAGEKERRTLATLLTAPVKTIYIVWGKYLAVVTIGTLAGLLNVTTLGLTLLRVFAADPNFGAIEFQLTSTAVVQIAVAIIAIAAPLAAVMLLFACFARSFRDASYLLTPVLLVAAVPAMMSALPSFELNEKLAAVPLANAALLLKATFSGHASIGSVFIVLAVAIATTGALLLLVERVFADERVLFSTGGPRADLKSLILEPPKAGMETALALAAVVFVLDYYAGLFAAGHSPLVAVAITQLVCHALVAVAVARWLKAVGTAEMLGAAAIRPRHALAGALVGAGGWLGISLPAAWLTAAVIGGQAEAAEAFSAALDLAATPVFVQLLTLAVIPAIAEELLFRGVVYRLLLGSMSARAAVVVQAIVFGLFHGSVHRLLPTGLLGLVLGDLRRRTGSVVPGILAHMMTNATLILIETQLPPKFANTLGAPTAWALAGLALLGIAHAIVDSPRPKRVDIA